MHQIGPPTWPTNFLLSTRLKEYMGKLKEAITMVLLQDFAKRTSSLSEEINKLQKNYDYLCKLVPT